MALASAGRVGRDTGLGEGYYERSLDENEQSGIIAGRYSHCGQILQMKPTVLHYGWSVLQSVLRATGLSERA